MVNTLSFTDKKRVRKNFGKLKEVSKFPNLIEIQKIHMMSFFLKMKIPQVVKTEGCKRYLKVFFL